MRTTPRKGRKPAGSQLVDKLDASVDAKHKLRVFLDTLSGAMTVAQACRELKVNETRFYVLRTRWLNEAARTLEPRPSGRPRATPAADPAPEVRGLTARITELQERLELAELRQEIHRTMPFLERRDRSKKARKLRP